MYTKRFVQGPSLHEESCGYSENSEVTENQSFNLTGEDAKKIYDEITNLPSNNSCEIAEGKIKKPTSTSLLPEVSTSNKVIKNIPKPKLETLMRLCENNQHTKLRDLIETHNDIDIDEKDQFGWTLLISAACANSLETVDFLIQIGADWSICDKKGLSAFAIAKKHNYYKICDVISKWEKKVEFVTQDNNSDSSSSSESETETQYSSNSKISNNSPSSESCSKRLKYNCEYCGVDYTSKKLHSKSIAHLVCTSKYLTSRTHYGIPESNKGFQLMVRTGWDTQSGLGPDGKGQKFPIKTVLKRNRKGLGNDQERKAARITHFAPFDTAAVEIGNRPEDRLERTNTLAKREETKIRNKEKRKEINYRRELGSL